VDQTTLARLKEGDSAAATECYAVVKQWALRQKIPPDKADELAVDTLSAVYLAADSFRGEAKVDTWLIGIARRAWANRCRQERSHTSRTISLDEAAERDDDVHVEEMAIDRLAAEEAIGRLSEQERQAFLLRVRDGLSSEDIAERMGKSVAAVRSLKYRAVKEVGRYWRQFQEDSEGTR